MNTCPCCSDRLLRHIRAGKIYYYCQNCHQEMPNLHSLVVISLAKTLNSYSRKFWQEDGFQKTANSTF